MLSRCVQLATTREVPFNSSVTLTLKISRHPLKAISILFLLSDYVPPQTLTEDMWSDVYWEFMSSLNYYQGMLYRKRGDRCFRLGPGLNICFLWRHIFFPLDIPLHFLILHGQYSISFLPCFKATVCTYSFEAGGTINKKKKHLERDCWDGCEICTINAPLLYFNCSHHTTIKLWTALNNKCI